MDTNPIIYHLDIASGQLQWNDAFYEIFGYPRTEPADTLQWWTSHIHPEDAMHLNEAMNQILDPLFNELSVAYRFHKADGSYVAITDRMQVERNEEGEAVRLIGTITPATPTPAA